MLRERLDHCQKSLSDYLNSKRAAFPRFFFISDDELLSVRGNSDPTSIQVREDMEMGEGSYYRINGADSRMIYKWLRPI